MPKVSVIIPVFNTEKHLGECLDSVLGQTLKDIEVVCVDDGSADSSPRILMEYAAKDTRVKVVRQANAGPARARNAGIASASGKCIAFMDADDKYPSCDCLECLYKALEDSGCDIAGGRAHCFPEDDPDVALRNKSSDRTCAFPHFGMVSYADYQVPYRYWCYLYRAELVKSIRFPSLDTFEDVPFFVAAMAKARTFCAINKLVYAYRRHESNLTNDTSERKTLARLTGMRMAMDMAARHGYWLLFDHLRRAIRRNGAEHNISKWRLLRITGFANEVVHRFRKLLKLSRPLAISRGIAYAAQTTRA